MGVYLRIREEIQQIAMTAMPRELEQAGRGSSGDTSEDQLGKLIDSLIFECRKLDLQFNDWETE